MSRALVRCGWCKHEQTLPAEKLTLHQETQGWQYRFVCKLKECARLNVKRAVGDAKRQLTAMGVRIVIPVPHPEDPPGGPPLTVSDVYDFVIDLETVGPWQELER